MNWELPRLAGKYPRSVAQMIHRRAIPIWQTSQRDVKELRIQLFADIQGAAATDDYKEDDAMFLLSDLDKGVDNAPLEELEKLAAELEANKKLDEWARKIAVAIVYNHIAWNHRGTGWAHTVKPEAWKEFRKYRAKARTLAEEAWKLRSDQPETAYTVLRIVGPDADSALLGTWFRRTVAAQFDHPGAYSTVLNYLKPRWGGSHRELLEFGKLCLQTGRFDTDVPLVFAEALAVITREMENPRELLQQPEIRTAVVLLGEKLVTEPSRTAEKSINLSMLALNAWYCGAPDEAAAALDQASWEIDPRVRTDAKGQASAIAPNISAAEMLRDLRQRRAGVSEVLGKARAAVAEKDYDQAVAVLRAAWKAADGDDARFFLGDELIVTDQARRFDRGETVSLLPDARLAGFLPIYGNWVVENGVLTVRAQDQRATLINDLKAGRNYEIDVVYQVEAPGNCCQAMGVAIGYTEGYHNSSAVRWLTCLQGRNGTARPSVGIAWGNLENPDLKFKACKIGEENRLQVIVHDGKSKLFLNGASQHPEYETDLLPFDGDSRVGLSVPRLCWRNTTSITRFDIRRTDVPPASEVR